MQSIGPQEQKYFNQKYKELMNREDREELQRTRRSIDILPSCSSESSYLRGSKRFYFLNL